MAEVGHSGGGEVVPTSYGHSVGFDEASPKHALRAKRGGERAVLVIEGSMGHSDLFGCVGPKDRCVQGHPTCSFSVVSVRKTQWGVAGVEVCMALWLRCVELPQSLVCVG